MQEISFYDFHVHVGERIAGYVLRDGFADLAKIPGLKGVGVFVTEEPGYSLKEKLQDMRKEGLQSFPGEILWHLTPVQTEARELLTLLSDDTDLKFYTTYKDAGLYRSYNELERWMLDLGDLKPRILVHCEDNETIEKYSRLHPFHRAFDHSLRRPEIAENIAVEKLLDLAVKQQYPVHIVHVSSPRSAQLIHQAKHHNSNITCETAPHYLIMNEDRLKGENAHRWICSPPLRSEKSRGELLELLQDGYFDIIATDHCAFTMQDKDRYKDEPQKVPCGIAGIGTMRQSLIDGLVQTGKIRTDYLTRLIHDNPAKMIRSIR